jgi:hypothetical protein
MSPDLVVSVIAFFAASIASSVTATIRVGMHFAGNNLFYAFVHQLASNVPVL